MSVSATRRQPLNRVSVHRSSGSRSLFKLRNSGRPTDTPISLSRSLVVSAVLRMRSGEGENETQIALSDSDRETARDREGERRGHLAGAAFKVTRSRNLTVRIKGWTGETEFLHSGETFCPSGKGIDLVPLFLVTRSPINFTYDGIIAEMSCIIRAW